MGKGRAVQVEKAAGDVESARPEVPAVGSRSTTPSAALELHKVRGSGQKKGRLERAAEKYKQAQLRLFENIGGATRREPNAPPAPTLDKVLANVGRGDGGVFEEDIELTSLAPPPHIDVVVQKQEHRLDALEAVVRARVSFWEAKHVAALLCFVWFTTILLGVFIGSLLYGVGPHSGSVSMGVLYSEGVEILPEDDDVDAQLAMLSMPGRASKISMGDGSVETSMVSDGGTFTVSRGGGRILVAQGGSGRRRRQLEDVAVGIARASPSQVVDSHHMGGVRNGAQTGVGQTTRRLAATAEAPFGSAAFEGPQPGTAPRVTLSPGGESGSVHIGGALEVHSGAHVSAGGLVIGGNDTVATVYSCDPSDPSCRSPSVVNSSNDLFSVDSEQRQILIGGPGGADIKFHGAVHFDASAADGTALPLSLSAASVDGDAKIGSHPGHRFDIGGSVTAKGNFSILPQASEQDFFVVEVATNLTHLQQDLRVDNSSTFGDCEVRSDQLCNDYFTVRANARFEQELRASGDVILGDEPTDVLMFAGAGHFSSALRVDADVFLGMDTVSKIIVGSDSELRRDLTVQGSLTLGGGSGLLPDIDTGSVMRVYADSTFKGSVDMQNDVTIGNSFVEDKLEIWSSTVVNNFEMNMIGNVQIGDSPATDRFTVNALTESFSRTEIHNSVILGTQFSCDFPDSVCEYLEVHYAGRFHERLIVNGDVILGDALEDHVLVNGDARLKGSIQVDGNLTLGTGSHDCFDESEFCNSMIVLEAGYCSTSSARFSCRRSCGFCVIDTREIRMNVASFSTFNKNITLTPAATLIAGGDVEISDTLNVFNDTILGDHYNDTVTIMASSIIRSPMAVDADLTIGSPDGAQSLLVNSHTTFAQPVVYEGHAVFGNDANDTVTYLGVANFRGDVSLSTENSTISADGPVILRGSLTVPGSHTKIGDDGLNDTFTITAETHVVEGTLYTHSDTVFGDAAVCLDALGTVVDSGDQTDQIRCERTGHTWNEAFQSCAHPDGSITVAQNMTACELTGNSYSEDRLTVRAISTFSADVLVDAGADVRIGTTPDDGSTMVVHAPSTFNSNVTLGGGTGSMLSVNTTSVFKSAVDVGGAVGLYGPSLIVHGSSTFFSSLNCFDNVTLGSNSSQSVLVPASAQFDSNVSFGGHVKFAHGSGSVQTFVDLSRGVRLTAAGSSTFGTSEEDLIVVQATTQMLSPLELSADFSVQNVSTGLSTLPWMSVSASTGRVDMRGDVHVQGKFYSASEFDLINVRCDRIDSRDVTNGQQDTGVLIEGVRLLQGGFPEQLKVSNIGEYVSGSGVLIDDVWMKDGVVVMESARPGATPIGELDMLTLINSGYHATNMANTIAAIRFQQFYYHSNLVNHAPDDSAKITVGTETSWTEDPLTRDAFFGISVTENGDSKERVHVASTGDVSVLNNAGVPVILLSPSLGGSIGVQNDITAGGSLTITGADSALFTTRTTIDAFDQIVLMHRGSDVLKVSSGLVAITEDNVLSNASHLIQYFDTDYTLQYHGASNASLAPTQLMDSTNAKLQAPVVTLEGMTTTRLRGHVQGVTSVDAMHCLSGLDSVGGPVHLVGAPNTIIDATDTLQLMPVQEACTASDFQACAAVALGQPGTAAACTSGPKSCTYTQADVSNGVSESCVATAYAICSGVALDGTESTCTNAGSCSYTAAAGAVVSISSGGTTIEDNQITLTGTSQLAISAESFTLRQTGGTASVLSVGASGTQLTDSTISLTAAAGITVTGGGNGTIFQDDVVANSDVYVKTATCGDGTACSGTFQVDSGTTVINGQASVKIQHLATDVLSVSASGTLVTDSTISAIATDSTNLVAGNSFTIRHGTTSDPAAMQVNAAGTLLQDSLVTLTSSDRVVVQATNGFVSQSLATLEAGLVQTGGQVNIAASPTISMSASTDVTISGSNSVVLRHGVTPVISITNTKTEITDNVVELAASASMLLSAANTFTIQREQNQPAVMTVNGAGTTFRDSQVGFVGSAMVFFQGGTQGSHFYDQVTMYTGLQQGSSDCRANTNLCGSTDMYASQMLFDSKSTTTFNADTSFKIKHLTNDVLSITGAGTSITDDVIFAHGATSTSLKSDGILSLLHGSDTVISIASLGTVISDSKINLTGTTVGGATPGISISAGGTGTFFSDAVTINAPASISTTGAVSAISDTILLKGATSTKIQRPRVSSCAATDAVSCSHFSGAGNAAACTGSGYACTFTASNICEATHLAGCAGITSGGAAACVQSGSGMPCTYTAAGDVDIFKIDSTGTHYADHTISSTATVKAEHEAPAFVIKQSSTLSHPSMVVDASGMLLSDSSIILQGTTSGGTMPGISVTGGGTGTAFFDMVTLQSGLNLTAGILGVASDSTASIHSDQDMTLDSTTSLKLQHATNDVLVIDSTGYRVTDNVVAMTGTVAVNAITGPTGTFAVTHGTAAGLEPSLLIDAQGLVLKDSKITITGTSAVGGTVAGMEVQAGGSGTLFKDIVSFEKGLHLIGGSAQVSSDSSVFLKANSMGAESCAATDIATCAAITTGQAACESSADALKCSYDSNTNSCQATDLAACAAITPDGAPSVCTDPAQNGNLACSYSGGGLLTLDASSSIRLRHSGADVVSVSGSGTSLSDDVISVVGSSSLGMIAEGSFTLVQGSDSAVCPTATLTGRQSACQSGGSAAGKCSYTAPNTNTGTGDSCVATDTTACANIVVTNDPTVCTDTAQNGNRACSYTAQDGCFATDINACVALSAAGVCQATGDCTYTPQKTGSNAVAESCLATQALRIDSSGMFLEDSAVSVSATAGIFLSGGSAGVQFQDSVVFDAGLTVSAGIITASTTTSSLAASDSLMLKHGSDTVLSISSTGTTVTDSSITMTASNTMHLEAGSGFSVAHGIGGAVALQIGSGGTTITDDILTVTGSTRIDLTGGSGGTVFRDATNMKGVTTLEDSLIMSAASASASLTLNTALVNAATSVKLQQSGTDVLSISAAGTIITDDTIALTGTSSIDLTAGSTFKLVHSSNPGACAAVDLTHSNTQTACGNAGTSPGNCAYTAAQPSTGTGDSCAAVDLTACANIVVTNDPTVCTDSSQNGNRLCSYTVQNGCFATDEAACSAISTSQTCTNAGTCSYTPQRTTTPTAVESCEVTNALLIDSSGMTLEDSYINIKANQIDFTTSTFNVPVDVFTVDGSSGVQFSVDGSNGNTLAKGDLTIGGPTVPNLRTLTVSSGDNSAMAVISAADATKDATLRLTDASGQDAFDIMKDDTVLKLQAQNVAGVIELNPGATTGEVRVNSDKFVVSGATGATAVRGDITVGGASITGVKKIAVQSNDNHARLELTSGPSSQPTVAFADGTYSFELTMNASVLKLETPNANGNIHITPGTTSGKLIIGPGSGLNVEIDTATANVGIDGNLNVEGTSSLNALDIETALATGSSSSIARIDKATGILTTAASTLTPYTTNSQGTLTTSGGSPNVDIQILDSTRITTTSVVIATIVSQCNANTVVTIMDTVCTAGRVTFKAVNLGTQACASESYKIAFVVLN